MQLPDFSDQPEGVLAWHHHVGHEDSGKVALDRLQRLPGRFAGRDGGSVGEQNQLQEIASIRVVVDDQDMDAGQRSNASHQTWLISEVEAPRLASSVTQLPGFMIFEQDMCPRHVPCRPRRDP